MKPSYLKAGLLFCGLTCITAVSLAQNPVMPAIGDSLNTEQAQNLPADGKVSGKITDSKTNRPVDFASVALVNNASGQTAKAAQTDLQGNFTMQNIPYGLYTLKVSFVGYQPYAKDSIIIGPEAKEVNVGTIKLLQGKANVLQEVVIQAQRSSIQLGIDRKVFSVDQSLVSQGGSATDLLANVPTVSVDIDGNVSLRGTNNVRVLIDGKPSAIGGGNIAQILQTLPASAIETIELITNPSSKYDPEGQSGIINIVLKKNKVIGLNGAVALTAGSLNNYNASTSLSYRNEKVNLYGNYSFRTGDRLGGSFSNTRFLNGNGIVNNNSDSRRSGVSNNIKLGTDYYLNSKTSIGLSANLSFRNSTSNEDLNYLYQNIPDQNGSSFRATDRDGTDEGYDLSLDFSRQLKRKGESLIANFSFGQDKEGDLQNFNQDFFAPGGSKKDSIDSRINNNGEFRTSYNAQIDYTLPFTDKQKFEVGLRSTMRNDAESQVSDAYNQNYGEFMRDYGLTNDFFLDDIVHAIYTNYQNQLTDKFGFQVGLRGEQAYLNTQYRGIDLNSFSLNNIEGKLDYLRVYPSVFLTQKLASEQQLQLSYTRRVNRPRGWQINPFRDISDPNNIRVGNPGLRPEDIHSFDFSYLKYWKAVTLTSSVYFRQVNDVVEDITQPITGSNAQTITQYFNLTRSRAAGLEFISKADITKGVNLTGNVNLYYNQFEGSEEYFIRSNSGFNWNANLTGNFEFLKNMSGQFNMNYSAPRVSPQGRSSEYYGLDAALRIDVLKNKAGSISFNMRDIFNSRRWGSVTETSAFVRDSEFRMQGRLASLTFSYRFGNQELNQRNKRNTREEQPGPDEEMMN